jgi:hypothetical protein
MALTLVRVAGNNPGHLEAAALMGLPQATQIVTCVSFGISGGI